MHSDIRDQKDGRVNGRTVEQSETQSEPCILYPSISFETQFRASQPGSPYERDHPPSGVHPCHGAIVESERAASILRISILNSNYSPVN